MQSALTTDFNLTLVNWRFKDLTQEIRRGFKQGGLDIGPCRFVVAPTLVSTSHRKDLGGL